MSHFAWHRPVLSPIVLYLHVFSQQLRTSWTWLTEGSDSHACELFLNTFSIALGTDKLFFNVRHAYHLIHPHFLLEYVWTMKRQFCPVDSVSVMYLSYTGFNTTFTEFLFVCFFKVKVHLQCFYQLMNKMLLKLNFMIIDEAVIPNLWYLYCLHLGTCLKCKLSSAILNLVSQKFWGCLNKPSGRI